MSLRVLFIGGTGVISSACSKLAVDRGFELFLLTRGSSFRPIPSGAQTIHGDIRDPKGVEEVLGKQTFDVVVNWVAFTTDHIETDIRLFKNRTGQYIFISSASVYAKPAPFPVTESAPVANPHWDYARAKIACEQRLDEAASEEQFPVTIVRPSHTYDETMLPVRGRYTIIDRMRKGKKVIVHGDGTSLWTLTHHEDFALGFTGLLGNTDALNQTYHITSNAVLTWNEIFGLLGRAAGVEPKIVHVPSDLIASYDPDWGASLLGDKAHSMVFDNSKIKQIVSNYEATIPFSSGAAEIINWYDRDPERREIDGSFDRLMDRIISAYDAAKPS